MTHFLAVVDRDPNSEGFESVGRIQDLLKETGRSYRGFIGSDYNPEEQIQAATRNQSVYLLHWQRYGTEVSLASNERSWAITAGHMVSSDLVAKVKPRGGSLVYTEPVWGQYAAVFGSHDSNQVFAWNTTPALEGIHWGATDEYVVISNRPLLVSFYLAHTRGKKKPELSMDYLPEYLYYGYSITGQTPFANVRTLAVNSALIIRNGAISLSPVPFGLQSTLDADHTLGDGAEALAAALTNAMDRTEDQINGRPLQLRLSGGKDSRLLLGLLRERQLQYRVVTFGKEKDIDVKLASFLCQLVGIDGEVRTPRPAPGDTISRRITWTLKESAGIPASEPHTAQYLGADPEISNEAIMLGQWPLYKGGMARNLATSPDIVQAKLREQGGALVNDATARVFDEHLLSWANQLTVTEEAEKLYLFAREFRSGRYLHAHVSQFASSSMLAYPIADAEVTAVCDALTMNEKISEKALFGALALIWPEVMKVPLDRSQWRFERHGKDPVLSGEWFEERRRPVPEVQPSILSQSQPVVSEYSDAAAMELANHLVASEYYSDLCPYLAEEMIQAVAEAAEAKLAPPLGMVRKMFIKSLWRLVVAERWLAQDWLD